MTANTDCSVFLDQLEAWLAGDCNAEHMQSHHDSCAACQRETRLARAIGSIITALPELTGPDIRTPAVTAPTGQSWVHGLLRAWRQPLVFVPALALLLAMLMIPQLHIGEAAIEPDVVIIDGEIYTREEIRKAAADLELALRYIDKYGTYPAKVISAELDASGLPLPASNTNAEPGTDSAPTI